MGPPPRPPKWCRVVEMGPAMPSAKAFLAQRMAQPPVCPVDDSADSAAVPTKPEQRPRRKDSKALQGHKGKWQQLGGAGGCGRSRGGAQRPPRTADVKNSSMQVQSRSHSMGQRGIVKQRRPLKGSRTCTSSGWDIESNDTEGKKGGRGGGPLRAHSFRDCVPHVHKRGGGAQHTQATGHRSDCNILLAGGGGGAAHQPGRAALPPAPSGQGPEYSVTGRLFAHAFRRGAARPSPLGPVSTNVAGCPHPHRQRAEHLNMPGQRS